MTIEEAQAKIAGLEGQLSKATGERDTNARQAHAMRAVLKAHNIGFDVDKADLAALTVGEDGAVAGEFAYTPPATQTQQTQQTQQAQQTQQTQQQTEGLKFSIEDVKKMSEAEINANWDDVSKTLESQGKDGQ